MHSLDLPGLSSYRQRRAWRKTRVARQQNADDRGDAVLCPERSDPHDVMENEDGEDALQDVDPPRTIMSRLTRTRLFRLRSTSRLLLECYRHLLTAKIKTCSSPCSKSLLGRNPFCREFSRATKKNANTIKRRPKRRIDAEKVTLSNRK